MSQEARISGLPEVEAVSPSPPYARYVDKIEEYKQTRTEFMRAIGLVTTEGATVEHLLTTVVASLAGPSILGTADRIAYLERQDLIASKPFSTKVGLLALVWPPRWTTAKHFTRELAAVGNLRNEFAHTRESVDFYSMAQRQSLEEFVPSEHWYRTTRNGKTKRVSMTEVLDAYADLNLMVRKLSALMFVDHFRNAPIDIEWVLANEMGWLTRVDKPEQQEGFAGWVSPRR